LSEPSRRALWFIDSSVILRALLDGSLSVRRWWQSQREAGAIFVASRMLEVEVRRSVHNVSEHGGLAISSDSVSFYLGDIFYIEITRDIINAAIAIKPPLTGADSIHVATALGIGNERLAVVTHDAQMARAVKFLGFQAIDPVTDDPKRPPVA